MSNKDLNKSKLAKLKAEWEAMKEQEKKLKEKFYSSPFEKKAQIKRELEILQKAIFKKKECGSLVKNDIKKEELLQRLNNPVGDPTDPKRLADLIKADLKAIINSDREVKDGARLAGEYWEIDQDEFWVFVDNEEIKKGIENLARNRNKTHYDPERLTTQLISVKRGDLSTADFDEIIKLIRQAKKSLEKKDKQQHEARKSKLKNTAHLFSCHECSTDPDYNGIGHWQNWHAFDGYHNGFEYQIMVPDNHLALTNVLFNDNWGNNSEIKNLYVVEGVAAPTELCWWNNAKQRHEIISEEEARWTDKKVYYIKFMGINDKIAIRHYDEKSDQSLSGTIEGHCGINKEVVENDNHQYTITHSAAKNTQSDNDFLLQFFQKNNIKQIELTPQSDLLIKFNDGKSQIINKQVSQSDLRKVISYCLKSGKTSLNQQDLINNTSTINPKNNNALLISFGIVGALIIGVVIGLWLRKIKQKNIKEN